MENLTYVTIGRRTAAVTEDDRVYLSVGATRRELKSGAQYAEAVKKARNLRAVRAAYEARHGSLETRS